MTLDPLRPWQFFAEEERSAEGEIQTVNTIFLTNRECPWRCVMCDLWKNTLKTSVPPGAIPQQIVHALERLPAASVIKLYNSGSFFDPHAIPVTDYPAIADLLGNFERVVVESHPALIGDKCLRFRDLVAGRLEVAMGLETVHPEVLPKLNKGMTLEQFSTASKFLETHQMDLRAFILVRPPSLSEPEALYWGNRSLDFAFSCGATVASLIPTRSATPPRIQTLEACQEYGLELRQGRVFADLWDLGKFSTCEACYAPRHSRLRQMNLLQTIPPVAQCAVCGVPA
ncbi:MAG: radical SAM protein [Terriglobia bacterium]